MGLKLVFMGSPLLACNALEAVAGAGHEISLVVTQPDRPAGRGRKLTPCHMAEKACEMGLCVAKPEKVGEMAEDLAAVKADACLVMAMGQILPQKVLDIFPLGCINLHTSLLPELRGASPINTAIVEGLERTGVSTMFMDKGLDTGDIILQEETVISPRDTAGTLADRLSAMGADLLVKTLELLEQGAAPRIAQDDLLSSYAPLLKKSDGLLNWSQPAGKLDCLVRGLDPWPGAFTTLDGKTLKLFSPTKVTADTPDAEPGSLINAPDGSDDLLWVACGQGALGLGQVQAAGKKRNRARDFIRGARLAPGLVLGK